MHESFSSRRHCLGIATHNTFRVKLTINVYFLTSYSYSLYYSGVISLVKFDHGEQSSIHAGHNKIAAEIMLHFDVFVLIAVSRHKYSKGYRVMYRYSHYKCFGQLQNVSSICMLVRYHCFYVYLTIIIQKASSKSREKTGSM